MERSGLSLLFPLFILLLTFLLPSLAQGEALDDSDIIYATPSDRGEDEDSFLQDDNSQYLPPDLSDDDGDITQASNANNANYHQQINDETPLSDNYAARLPSRLSSPGEKVILIDPRVHAWGAYLPNGQLIRAGLATAGGNWCNDTNRPCRTKVGSFRIFSLGGSDCVSSLYPLGGGGAPMPYCMFFNGNQGLHGANQVIEGNVSHGCVRVSVRDAAWIRFNFAVKGTKIVVRPY